MKSRGFDILTPELCTYIQMFLTNYVRPVNYRRTCNIICHTISLCVWPYVAVDLSHLCVVHRPVSLAPGWVTKTRIFSDKSSSHIHVIQTIPSHHTNNRLKITFRSITSVFEDFNNDKKKNQYKYVHTIIYNKS